MRPNSIRALVEGRDIRGEHFLDAPRQVPLRKMHAVREFHHVAEKIGALAEALENSGNFRPPGIVLEPLAVKFSQLARGVVFVDPVDAGSDIN